MSLDAIAAASEIRAAKNLCVVEICCALLDGIDFDDADQRLAKRTCGWSLRDLAKELASELGVSPNIPDEVEI